LLTYCSQADPPSRSFDRAARILATEGHAVAGAVVGNAGSESGWFDAAPRASGDVALVVGRLVGESEAGRRREAIVRRSAAASTPLEVLTALRDGPDDDLLVAFFDPRTGNLSYASTATGGPILALPFGPASVVPAAVEAVGERSVVSGELTLPPLALVALSTAPPAVESIMREACSADRSSTAASIAERVGVTPTTHPESAAALILTVAEARADRFSCSLPAIPFTAPFLRASLGAFAQSLELDDERTFALQTAVGEAVANSIEHAYRRGAGGLGAVRVSIERHQGDVVVLVEDDGEWRLDADPCFTRGRGLPLMRALVDLVDIVSDGRSTTVRLTLRGNSAA